jgi:hypothetical protein
MSIQSFLVYSQPSFRQSESVIIASSGYFRKHTGDNLAVWNKTPPKIGGVSLFDQ